MPLLLDTAQSASVHAVRGASCVNVGLINNMPDTALEATERQFSDLIRAGSRDTVVRLLLFAIPEVPRGEAARRDMAGRYRDIAELWDTQLDGLIVTGNEPKSKNLTDEPYWAALSQVIDWARGNTYSTIWSCLAAHAAVFASDGIERRPYAEKLSGLFACAAGESPSDDARRRVADEYSALAQQRSAPSATSRPPAIVFSPALPWPASIPSRARRAASICSSRGIRNTSRRRCCANTAAISAAFCAASATSYPDAPQDYFDTEAVAWAEAFRERAIAERHGDLIKNFPMRALEAGLAGGWHSAAGAIYANWFEYLKGRKAEQRSPLQPMRRAWRDWPLGGARPNAVSPATAR